MDHPRLADIPDPNFSTYALPPLPPTLPLPPLPPITDPYLRRLAFTHASIHNLPRRSHDLGTNEVVEDYEKMEHVGDALLGSVVTVLLHDLYPGLREGPATMLKGYLVSNATLAQISDRYHIPAQIVAAPSALHVTRAQQKTKASMFEAYIASLYYSFLGVRGSFGPPSEEGPAAASDYVLRERDQGEEDDDIDEAMSSDADDGWLGEDGSDRSTKDEGELGSRSDSSEPDNGPLSSEEDGEQEDEAAKTTTTADMAIRPVQPQNSGAQEVSMPSRTSTASFKSAKSHLEPNDKAQVADHSTHPTHHPPQTSEGGRTHDIQSSHANPPARPTRGQAYDHIDSFLRTLFAPLARWALQCMRDEQSRLFAQRDQADGMNEEDGKAAGYLGALNIHVAQAFGGQPVYTFEGLQERLWRARCVVVDDKGEEYTGDGIRSTKKAAQTIAAYKVCVQLGLVE
ncbi:hypothetical protein EHS25_010174 [Saitozyma podzolica]|uniref:RNase III domain-containing protein n=1 Tax=Saitozyma podzolica TaxID=1890683 RepID=A0A427YIT6_9TREE|nr:hypothetical protein EHS25_010174 [Saitozyma podzolica]